MTYSLNRLIRNLIEVCAGHAIEEKWLIAPSLRVGMQWLDAVARGWQPVFNFRVKTLRGLALDMATPIMEERGQKLLTRTRAEVLIDRAFGSLSGRKTGYLSDLSPSPGLTETLARAISELRLAGLFASDIGPGDFEVETKGKEVKALLGAYEEGLFSSGLVDYPGALRVAIERLEGDTPALDGSRLVAIPDRFLDELSGLERTLWEAIPAADRLVIETDHPGEIPDGPATNSRFISFVSNPSDAPVLETIDDTVGIFRAVGEVNEVREVLRRCVEAGIPFDEVELLHTDAATYVPLIYELCCRLRPDDPASMPVTFYEGIPSTYSRPARALLGWLEWINSDYPQSAMVNLVADGLLRLDQAEERGSGFARLGAVLRAVPIGGRRDRYLGALDKELRALTRQLEEGGATPEEGYAEETPDKLNDHKAAVRERMACLTEIRAMVAELLKLAPPVGGCSQREYLDLARAFLQKHARRSNEFDQYCHKRLVEDIAEVAESLAEGDIGGFDPVTWLTGLPGATSVEGKGPRPGCLYVSNVRGGGQSGRKHTFIIGLDDSRFPGSGRQDPLLLDGERSRISGELQTGAGRLARDVLDFAGLLAGLRGEVTLGYCCRSLVDDREMFPSPVVLSVYRILDRRDGDQKDLARWVGEPASFAPSRPERCIDPTEWWLSRTCGDLEAEGLEQAIALSFPNLARGFAARASRASDAFTEYDGYVPEAGAACDPAGPDGPALSASRLETLARCPLEYFFKYVLKIEPPQEYEVDPTIWLDPAQRGELLHSAFREFMTRITGRGLKPDFERDTELLREVLDEEISHWESRCPAPGAAVFEREKQDLHSTARIFLKEEHEHCRESRPAFFEVSIGLVPEDEGSLLDSADPVAIELPGGLIIRALGRIDRVDELPSEEGACYAIWDYKTGSSYGYRHDDPFRQGRHIQNALYLELASARLGQTYPDARVVRSGYFFPGLRAHGERVTWDEVELAGARPILARLCRMIATGCFPFTDDPDNDLLFSDYTAAFGDVAVAARDIRRKLENPDNRFLQPFRELREYIEAVEEVTQ